MGRQRFNKKDWIEKANRLFESRNKRTIMEQAGETITCYACIDGNVVSSPVGEPGEYSYYPITVTQGEEPGLANPIGPDYNPIGLSPTWFGQEYCPYAGEGFEYQGWPNYWFTDEAFVTSECNSGSTVTTTGTTLEGPFCCDLNSNSYGFGPDGVSVNIDGAVDMYVMENGPEGELCDESLCKPCDAAEMASYLSSFEPAPGISTMEFCAKCQTGSWDPFFGGSPEQCECCEPETDVDPDNDIDDEGCDTLVSDPINSACCTKCMSGSVTSEDDPCWPHCFCCPDYVSDTSTEGGYNCKTGLMGSGCVPCGPSGDCEFESLGACQNSGCEDDGGKPGKGNDKKTRQRKKPERLREEYTRMKTLWGYKF